MPSRYGSSTHEKLSICYIHLWCGGGKLVGDLTNDVCVNREIYHYIEKWQL